MKIKSSLLLLSILGVSAATATTVLTENFSYGDGALVGASGSPWVTHSGTAGQADIVGATLVLTSAEGEDINAPLSGQPYSSGFLSSSFDVTFTVLPTLAGSYFAHFKDSATGFRSRLVSYTTGASSGFFRLAISNDSGVTVPVATDLALNTTYAVVMTWDLDTNQSTLSVDGGAAVTDSDAASAITITSFAFRQATGIGTMTVDNLTVTHVPEPAAALLGAFGVIGLLRRRRLN
jgi:hypothetical protein